MRILSLARVMLVGGSLLALSAPSRRSLKNPLLHPLPKAFIDGSGPAVGGPLGKRIS